ncbi:DUF5694 domain-containing protein [Salimicrobium flavidum]|uniref:Uncharacterized protein n=1 Tax=Salimicrobium flavidum TaxID=570947 RepID=A0A1N7JHU5_9BACI|nr:DUF5694 domain-containing protein [Salimicrobium flavidum]SIS48836.1 hypothetical protein SAMN05421687_10649 [Salimicrobium flavidum]
MTHVLLVATPNFSVHPSLVQEEVLTALSEKFASFEPTALAIEKNYYLEEEINKNLHAYIEDDFVLTHDSMEQFAFRTAKQSDLPSLHMIDELVDMSSPSLEQVFTWAEEYQPELLKDIITIKQKADRFREEENLVHYLTQINREDYLSLVQNLHATLNIVGDRHHQVGTSWLKQSFEKNLAIAANIERLCVHEERVLVFVSEETLPLLKNMIRNSGRVTIEDPLSYLKVSL